MVGVEASGRCEGKSVNAFEKKKRMEDTIGLGNSIEIQL